MTSMKAKKGNPFEYDTAYSLQSKYTVTRIDDNTKGVDLIATNNLRTYAIECKFHQSFSWNSIEKIFLKTEEFIKNKLPITTKPLFIFKSNLQPVLVAHRNQFGFISITKFDDYFNLTWSKRPKGYKIWQTK